ncbi:MAG: 30S ribosomal protein S6e [Thermoplasmata archaeon]|nr:30S ribosomal protein S6e [Thermoplasmata archaeon]RLF56249.1 MAG: 30S ribosomal protein S6e [Thermoplasmata archaeon]RLF72090.1 MAG: 30S ribosomal protein S6e [Thermoplasmata archaeon]
MVEFKAVIGDPKTGKTYQKTVTGQYANRLLGMKIGDVFDGIFVSLPGYKLKITGGSDKDGTPMRPDLPGTGRRKLLLSGGVGFHPVKKGERRRKMVRGNTISPEIVQINMKVVSHGARPIEELLKEEEKS